MPAQHADISGLITGPALPALVPCLGPLGGVYYPKSCRANACRIQGVIGGADKGPRDIVVAPGRPYGSTGVFM